MNKKQLTVHISNLLQGTIEAYEAADLCLEEHDMGALYSIHDSLEIAVKYLRLARRMGRVLQEQYEENLDKKPEYLDRADSINEDDGDDGDDDDD
jgi:hypothetical protein